ncbi:MAG: hypothetical protein V4819_09325 [Verrucomicrobiota bacterium]
MEIRCPTSLAKSFGDIPNCFIGELDVSTLFPRSAVLAQTDFPPVELIYEATDQSHHRTFEVDTNILRSSIEAACAQYAANIAPEPIVERFQDYLTESIGLSVDDSRDIFRKEGILPFLTLERIFVSEPYSAICFDFYCSGEEYLNEYGFSFDLVGSTVDFVTPRSLLIDGGYPATRKKNPAEQVETQRQRHP